MGLNYNHIAETIKKSRRNPVIKIIKGISVVFFLVFLGLVLYMILQKNSYDRLELLVSIGGLFYSIFLILLTEVKIERYENIRESILNKIQESKKETLDEEIEDMHAKEYVLDWIKNQRG